MTKNQIIEHLCAEQFIENTIKKFIRKPYLSPNYQDLAQDLYLDLMTKTDDLIVGLYDRGEMERFIVQMIKNNIFSYSSRFYKNYRKMSLCSDDIDYYIQQGKETELRYD